MAQIAKVFSLVFVLGVSLLPFGNNLLPKNHPAPARSFAVAPSLINHQIRLDGLTPDAWSAIQAAEDAAQAKAAAEAAAAALAAEQARAAAEAKAAAAAAAPRGGAAQPPAAARPSAGYVQDLIRQAFAPQGPVAVEWGLRVAACESGYNPNAFNPGGPSGVFQFMPGTFGGTPYGSQNIFDAVANVNAAAWYYQRYGGGAWACK